MLGKLFIISAPSGAGKTTLVNKVLPLLRGKHSIDRVVTYTSRPVRYGEKNGQDYHFVSSVDFEQKIRNGFFLEWTGEYGHYYGTPMQMVRSIELGLSQILVITRAGASRVLEIAHDPSPTLSNCVVPIWICTSTIDELRMRLLRRGENTQEQIERRIKLAQSELEQESEYSLYKYSILNDHFLTALKELETIMLAELQK